jgi:hypothetical protein
VFNNPGPSLTKLAIGSPFGGSIFVELHQQRGAPGHAARVFMNKALMITEEEGLSADKLKQL